MCYLHWEAACYDVSDAEDKLPSLRIRKIKQLQKWLKSITPEYAEREGIDLLQVEETLSILDKEMWLREMQLKGEID